MIFDIYVTGIQIETTKWGTATNHKRKLVVTRINQACLKRSLRNVVRRLGLGEYNLPTVSFDSFSVYPAASTLEQMAIYDGLLDESAPFLDEFNKLRLSTHNFDVFRRWKYPK